MQQQDDDQFVREALGRVNWPKPSLHMKADIMRAIDTPQAAESMMPFMMKGMNLPRFGGWLAALMLVFFGCGLLAGSATAQPETTDPLYKDSGTVIMAQLLE